MTTQSESAPYTRRQYLADYTAHYPNGGQFHRKYYSQFVSPDILRLVGGIGTEHLKQSLAADPHLNNIPIRRWDTLAFSIKGNRQLHNLMDQCGDWASPASLVCILKEAAEQIVESLPAD